MAHDAMARDLPPIEAVPPPPPQSFSRYRTLRGKSVSSPRDFDVYRDHNGSPESEDDVGPGQGTSSGSPRSRSKSVSNLRNMMRSQEPPPAMPALPALPPLPLKVLSPRPINISAQSTLKILENLKSPIFNADHPPWKSLSHSNKSTNKGVHTKQIDCAVAGPHIENQGGDDRERLDEREESHQNQRDEKDKNKDKDGASSAIEAKGDDKSDLVVVGECAASDEQQPQEQSDTAKEQDQDTSIKTQDTKAKGDTTTTQFAHEVARLEAETDRILAEQKKLDLARLQAQLVTPPPKSRRPLLDKLTFFSRNKRSTAGSSQPGTPSTIVSAIFSPAFSQSSRDSSLEEPPTPSLPFVKMSFIQPGGKGIVPQFDAPLSASNGGERRVIVRCLSSTINLPVTADTTSVDILKATADMTRHHISPATSVIVECYFVLGLERRLRRYERVRDVMNSWDRDQQNSLLIMPCDSAQSDQDLDLESVPRTEEPPQGFSMQMHHSSKPGKWNKRWVTLLENGQIYAAKSPNAKPSDKDSSVLCHLTDFDIYAPKESEMRRNLKPPKKFCYAIKSQQKTVVFAHAENFVHFFSTEDAKQAACFYEKVHAWRSWYLVNRMVDLEKKNRVPQLTLNPKSSSNTASPKRSMNSGNRSARASTVAEEAEKEGEEPLMNVNAFRMSQIIIAPEDDKVKKSMSVRSKAPVQRSNTVKKPAATTVEVPKTVREEEPEFAAGGLLGNAYEKRKQADAASDASSPLSPNGASSNSPFTEAPSLLNGGISNSSSDASDHIKRQAEEEERKRKEVEARSWFPSAAEHSARIRSQVVLPQQPLLHHQQRRPATGNTTTSPPMARRGGHPAPLLSFTKDFPEPPRFRDGPSGVRQVAGQPLINYAAGGAVREAQNSAPRRNVSRRGLPSSNSGGLTSPPPPPQHPPPPPGSQRTRSKSSASSQRRYNTGDAHHPPMPAVSNRRHPHHGEPRGPPSRPPPEPLVNRAK